MGLLCPSIHDLLKGLPVLLDEDIDYGWILDVARLFEFSPDPRSYHRSWNGETMNSDHFGSLESKKAECVSLH